MNSVPQEATSYATEATQIVVGAVIGAAALWMRGMVARAQART